MVPTPVEALHRPGGLNRSGKVLTMMAKNKLFHSVPATEQTLTCDGVLADSKALSCAGRQRSPLCSDLKEPYISSPMEGDLSSQFLCTKLSSQFL